MITIWRWGVEILYVFEYQFKNVFFYLFSKCYTTFYGPFVYYSALFGWSGESVKIDFVKKKLFESVVIMCARIRELKIVKVTAIWWRKFDIMQFKFWHFMWDRSEELSVFTSLAEQVSKSRFIAHEKVAQGKIGKACM